MEEDKPIKCPNCGKFMKVKAFIGQGSQELAEYSCKCGCFFVDGY